MDRDPRSRRVATARGATAPYCAINQDDLAVLIIDSRADRRPPPQPNDHQSIREPSHSTSGCASLDKQEVPLFAGLLPSSIRELVAWLSHHNSFACYGTQHTESVSFTTLVSCEHRSCAFGSPTDADYRSRQSYICHESGQVLDHERGHLIRRMCRSIRFPGAWHRPSSTRRAKNHTGEANDNRCRESCPNTSQSPAISQRDQRQWHIDAYRCNERDRAQKTNITGSDKNSIRRKDHARYRL